jgi:hypothetical protein
MMTKAAGRMPTPRGPGILPGVKTGSTPRPRRMLRVQAPSSLMKTLASSVKAASGYLPSARWHRGARGIGIAGGPGQDFGKRIDCEFIRPTENVEWAIKTEHANHAYFLGSIGDLVTCDASPTGKRVDAQAWKTRADLLHGIRPHGG